MTGADYGVRQPSAELEKLVVVEPVGVNNDG